MTQQEFFKRYTYSPSRDRIGGGGFGTVYKAYDNVLHREVAIKVSEVKTTTDGKKTFSLKDEFEALDRVPKHPNIANYEEFYSYEMPNGIFDYAVMQYYPDGNLSNAIKQGLTDEQKEDVAIQLLEGIDFLHKHKVVHRDLKPGNILIVKHGGKVIPLITDFGLSKAAGVVDGSVFSNSFGAGTPRYSSPEQLQGTPLRLNTDLWSYGAILYELFTGTQLFTAGSGAANTAQADMEIYNKIVNSNVQCLGKMPEKWCKVAERCLVVDATKRAKDAAELFSFIKGDVSDDNETLVESGSPKELRGFLASYLEKDSAKRPALREYDILQKDSSEDTISVNDVPYAMPPEPTECKAISETKKKMTITVNGVSFDMIKVEGGTFWMGAHCKKIRKSIFHSEPDTSTPNFDNQAHDIESPVHKVSLSSYYIGETQVTQELWHAVMGYNPSHFKGVQSWGKGLYAQTVINSIKQPVDDVSYDDIVNKFIPKLNNMTGKVFRLPTEAEWEFAARGGNESNGFKYAGSNRIEDVAWYNCKNPHPVRQLRDNELGIYDMSGNVAEWCLDWYEKYGSGSQSNPQGPPNGSYRVIRGGSWLDRARLCRVSDRSWNAPNERSFTTGFRLAISL